MAPDRTTPGCRPAPAARPSPGAGSPECAPQASAGRPVPRAPRDVSVLVTARCNLACRHCSVYGDGPIEGDLTLAQWRDIVRRLAEWKVLKLTVSGGEPLVREDFPGIVEAILEFPLRFSLNTNAMLVTDDIARVLARAAGVDAGAAGRRRARLESVMVSLDGAGPATHDAQRAPGSFDGMAAGVDRLRAAGVPVGFYCTVTTINVHELEAIAAWGLARGAYVKFNDVLAVGRACVNDELGLTQPQRRDAGRRVAALRERYARGITGTILDMHDFAERILAGTATPYPQGSRGCGAMRGRATVWADGRLSPCDRIPHFTIGNVLETALEDLWHNAQAKKFRDMLAVPIAELDTCRDCGHLAFCTGGCPVLPMRDGGEVLQRDPGGCVRMLLGEEVACG